MLMADTFSTSTGWILCFLNRIGRLSFIIVDIRSLKFVENSGQCSVDTVRCEEVSAEYKYGSSKIEQHR